jgi:hypothetical protein
MKSSAAPAPDPTVQLICVSPTSVRDIWPLAKPLLRLAIARTSLGSFSKTESDVLCGNTLLWLAVEGDRRSLSIIAVALTELQQTDAGIACVITACAGKKMPRWLHLIHEIEEFARREGCTCVRLFGRRGWSRALQGYFQKNFILERSIK